MHKQIIVVRKDLLTREDQRMTPGKLAAQVAHASLAPLLRAMEPNLAGLTIDFRKHRNFQKWLNGPFKKIVLYVKSEEKLLEKYKELEEAGFIVSLITDAGYTIFDKPTTTCFGVEPLLPEEIDPYTKKLQLLQ